MKKIAVAAPEMRSSAEHALESLFQNRAKARANQDTLADMTLAEMDGLWNTIKRRDATNQK